MPISLAEGKNNAQTDLDLAVIDEFRKESAILDSLIFDDAVNPSGGGDTLTYGYRRQITQATAGFRAINSEYVDQNVTTQHYTTDLAVLGGSFAIDRVVAKIGAAASGGIALNMAQKIKSTKTAFQDAVINGDTDDDANGFDGLDKALKGSATEFRPDVVTDWTDFDTNARAEHVALDAIDEFLGLLDGAPTVIVGNAKALARVRAAVRRAGQYVKNPIDGLLGPNGRPIVREQYGDVLLVDAGEKAGSSSLIIPTYTRDVDGGNFALSNSGTVSGGTFTVTITVDGGAGATTGAIAYNATAAVIETALAALANVGAGNVDVTGTTTAQDVAFQGDLSESVITLVIDNTSITGGGTRVVANTGTNTGTAGLTDLYAYRVGMDGFHAVSTIGGSVVSGWLPDFTVAGAVKRGEVELGPVSVALRATKAAAVFRNIKVASA